MVGYKVDDLSSFPTSLLVCISSLGTSVATLSAVPQMHSTFSPGQCQFALHHLLPHLLCLHSGHALMSSYLCGFLDLI